MKYASFRGFTLIEMAITVAIVGVLASAALPLTEMTVRRVREHELMSALREIRGGIDAYKRASDEGRIAGTVGGSGYPQTLRALVNGVADLKSANKQMIYFLRRIPRDPMNSDPLLPPEETWGLRSYESPPDEPREGEDVFDVYSRSQDVAIDGTAYGRW